MPPLALALVFASPVLAWLLLRGPSVSAPPLDAASEVQLATVAPGLRELVRLARTLDGSPWGVHEGQRDAAEQAANVARGVSRTLDSWHLPNATGLARAVDLVPRPNGQWSWNWELVYPVALAMRRAAVQLGKPVTWGGVWDRDLRTLPDSVDGLRRAVNDYSARRKAAGGTPFLDGVHFQSEG